MAYDERLADQIREQLTHVSNVTEKQMMGGLVFMVNDKMCVGIMDNELMCRIDQELRKTLVEKNGCRTMELGNRPMKGYVLVEQTVLKSAADFNYWINLCLEFNPRAVASKKKKT